MEEKEILEKAKKGDILEALIELWRKTFPQYPIKAYGFGYSSVELRVQIDEEEKGEYIGL